MGCWFSSGKRHIPKQIMDIVEDFVEKKLQPQCQTLEIVEDFACEDKNIGHLQRFRFVKLFLFFFFFFFLCCFSFFFSCFFFFFFSSTLRRRWTKK